MGDDPPFRDLVVGDLIEVNESDPQRRRLRMRLMLDTYARRNRDCVGFLCEHRHITRGTVSYSVHDRDATRSIRGCHRAWPIQHEPSKVGASLAW